MIRLAAVLSALVLFSVPFLTAAMPAVAVAGLMGLFLAVVGIAGLWRWPVTAAACVFLTDYAAALWVAGASLSVVGAAGFGFSLLLLLQAVELGRRLRRATVRAGVLRSQIARGVGFGAATLGATLLVMGLAGAVSASVPFAAAPFVATAGALGVVLAVAAAVTGASRTASRRSPRPPSP
jgi:hypothetical protein